MAEPRIRNDVDRAVVIRVQQGEDYNRVLAKTADGAMAEFVAKGPYEKGDEICVEYVDQWDLSPFWRTTRCPHVNVASLPVRYDLNQYVVVTSCAVRSSQ